MMKNKIRYVLLLAACGALAAIAADNMPRNGLLSRGGLNNGQGPSLRQLPRSTLPGTAGRTAATNGKAASPSANAVASASAATEAGGGEASSSDLNFKDAPGEMVFEVYGKLVGRTVLKDPQTPTVTISLQSLPGQKLTKEEQIKAIETVMEMNGVHFEPYGDKFVRALPRKDVRKVGIPLITNPSAEPLDEVENVVSMMLEFKNIPVDEAQKALEGFKSNSGLLQVFERTNKILVTDSQMNINRMVEIARAIDISSPVLENVFVRQIKHAAASEIKTALEQIVTESQKEQEKNGKNQQNTASQNATRMGSLSAGPTSLLRRPGMPGSTTPQQPAATSVESLVTSVSDADRGMIRGKVLIIADERSNKLLIVTMKSNMDFFDKVIEQLDVETTPDVQVKVYRLKYADAEDVSAMINDLIGNSASSKTQSKQAAGATAGSNGNLTRGTTSGAAPTAKQSANQRTGQSKAGELSKENVTVLADKRINGLVVMARTQDIPALEQIIESMDIKLSQVLIETMILQVGLTDEISTGIDWVAGLGTRSKTQKLDGGSGGTSLPIGSIDRSNPAAAMVTKGAGGLNYFAVSKALDLGAIVNASKSDSRANLVASPIIMTVDNKEAVIKATKMRYLLKGYTYSGSTYNGSAVPDYEQKEIGLTVKVTPKINPNGTVMLKIEEEFSALGESQTIQAATGGTTNINGSTQQAISGIQVETTVTRQLSADITVDNKQTVILGGLTQTETKREDSGIPILKDIPWIGRYLFGSTKDTEARQELLMFITPYVLDDSDSALAEAERRKRSMSDSKPWKDHSWSSSPLADQMSLKEQLKRKQREWKEQDEEHEIMLKLEKENKKRVEKLLKEAQAETAVRAKEADQIVSEINRKEEDLEAQRIEAELRERENNELLKKLKADPDGEVKK